MNTNENATPTSLTEVNEYINIIVPFYSKMIGIMSDPAAAEILNNAATVAVAELAAMVAPEIALLKEAVHTALSKISPESVKMAEEIRLDKMAIKYLEDYTLWMQENAAGATPMATEDFINITENIARLSLGMATSFINDFVGTK
jgi:hypothetical protein